MKTNHKFSMILASAGALTVCLISVMALGVLGASFEGVVGKLNADKGLILVCLVLLLEACLFSNDLFYYLAR